MAGTRYTNVAIALHWVIALLILGQIAGGLYMHNLPNSAPMKFDLYQLHKSFGLSVLLLTIARLGWRIGNPPPPLPGDMPRWQAFAARAIHWVFYGLMVAVPLVGLAIVSVSPKDIPTHFFGIIPVPHLGFLDPGADPVAREDFFIEVHEYFSFGILGLLALHVGAALKHGFINKDGVLASVAPQRASFIGVAGVFGFLALGSAIYFISKPNDEKGNDGAVVDLTEFAAAPASSDAPAWIVDDNSSRLEFVGVQGGEAFTGAFTDFSADIRFDADNLAASEISVIVSTASAATGDSLKDSTMPGGEWFAVKAHPAAVFTSNGIREDGDGYIADGVLTIKGIEQPVSLTFTLDIDGGDVARASGGADLLRTDFDLGAAASWLESEQVALEVEVRFEINAVRAQ